MDRGAWWATVQGVEKSRTQLSTQHTVDWLRWKESACNAGDLGSIPGQGRSLGEGNGNPLKYSCLENCWTEEPGSPWGHKQSDMTSH